jgi:glycine cleavage system H protein
MPRLFSPRIAKQEWKTYCIADPLKCQYVRSRESFDQRGQDMKEISELVTPGDARYTRDHEWARIQGEMIRIGITDYAQDQLGDIVFVEVPQVGKKFKKGEECGTIESVKAVAEVYMPVSGEITGVNTALEDSPGLVNTAPYTDGWIADVKPSDPSEMSGLMSNDAYLEMLKGLEE